MKHLMFSELRRSIAHPPHRTLALRITCATARWPFTETSWRSGSTRLLHVSVPRKDVKPYLLADIGEGITEVQIIQWFVQPGARVEQFDKICEVQSDKATVEITSRFDGIIKKLYYEADDTAKVGKPLVDIDIKSEISPEDEALTRVPNEEPKSTPSVDSSHIPKQVAPPVQPEPSNATAPSPANPPSPTGKHASLATPAVRHLIKELGLDITQIPGTGKDGRVLKEDVQRYAAAQKDAGSTPAPETSACASRTDPAVPLLSGEDRVVPLSAVQAQMYKTMARSLAIPHFLYSDNIDFSSLNGIRKKLNTSSTQKISALPFIIKAVSLALMHHPLLNSHLDVAANSSRPTLTYKASHNIGIAIDTPQGLVVPVVRHVQTHSILSLAAEISRLSHLARINKLSPQDFSDATFTISNIGSIGGGVTAPVIVSPQVAIVAVGRAKAVPAFGENGELVKKEEATFSWSADHRVVDGAEVARCAERVRGYLEGMEGMLLNMK